MVTIVEEGYTFQMRKCPFCGGRPFIDSSEYSSSIGVCCSKCGASAKKASVSPFYSAADLAVKYWNDRAEESDYE